MTSATKHKNDDPSMCWFCKNFRLIPSQATGVFICENKNSPEQLKLCYNYVERELAPEISFSILHDRGDNV